MVHSPGTPLRVWRPRSVNVMPDPAARSRTVEVASTSAGLCERADAGTDVYRDARQVVAAYFAFADVDAGTQVDSVSDARCGDCVGAAHRSRWSVEGCEEAVTGGVDLLTSEPFELRSDDRVVLVELGPPPLIADFGESFGRRDDVHEHHGAQYPVRVDRRPRAEEEFLDQAR